MRQPIPESYWVTPTLLAGEYPGARDEGLARRKVRRILAAGVTCFVDLTEENEHRLKPYLPLVNELTDHQITYARFPIRDMGVPEREQMRQTLDYIDAVLADGQCVYVHCWGGIGRTGTVVGCFLAQQGTSGQPALSTLARLRAHTPDSQRASPETAAQRQFVRDWVES